MIDSVLELVNKTTSNSLFMFLFCNFIIILILMGNSKPASQDQPNPGHVQPILISDSVLSSNPGFEKSLLQSESVTSSKHNLEKIGLISESALSSKTVSEKHVTKSVSVLSSKPGFKKPVLISESVISSKTGSDDSVLKSVSVLPSKPGLKKHLLISESNLALSHKPAGSEKSLMSEPGLRVTSSMLKPGLDISEKDEKGKKKKAETKKVRFEEKESEVECALRRRVEEFILKVNSQWKSENTKRLVIS